MLWTNYFYFFLLGFLTVYAVLSLVTYCIKKRVKMPVDKHIKASLSVVFPCKGKYNEAEQYPIWDKYLTQVYDGPVDYIYCVESEEDEAYADIYKYLVSKGIKQPRSFCHINQTRRIILKVTGLTYHCSQKIHQLLQGFNGQRTEYFLQMDEDMMVH